jgi:hypothetical protein
VSPSNDTLSSDRTISPVLGLDSKAGAQCLLPTLLWTLEWAKARVFLADQLVRICSTIRDISGASTARLDSSIKLAGCSPAGTSLKAVFRLAC